MRALAQATRMWIVWERQARSVELSQRLGCELHELDIKGWRRYPVSIARTVTLLVRRRPQELFIQNPSMLLAAIACVFGLVTKNVVVVDRHTTFLLNKPVTRSLKRALFLALHRFTLRTASLTIVTNEFLAGLVRDAGGRPFVLPDPIPSLRPAGRPTLIGQRNVLVVSSFSDDEPTEAVFEAARQLQAPDVHFYISGNHRKANQRWEGKAPGNVTLTGFLEMSDYVNLLFAVDAVMVLTTSDHTMLCGCYEALAAEKALITSDKPELREYFDSAAFVNANAASIASGIREVLAATTDYRSRSSELRERRELEWNQRLADLEGEIDGRQCVRESNRGSRRRS